MNAIDKLKKRGITPRAVLYARFSSDNQREESIDAQLRAMHKFCEDHGIVVVREFCDRAFSATTDARPAFLEMIAESKKREFEFVVVHKLDRFSRSRYDSAFYKRELSKNGVTILSVLEQMDDSPESIIMESVLEGMSEYYSRNLAREVMKGMRETALQCQYTGGHIPYGFSVDPVTRKFVINEEEAKAVRFAFNEVANGVGYGTVIKHLNELGFRTRSGNLFSKPAIHDILRNEKYNGIFVFNRASSKNAFGQRNSHAFKPLEEQIRIPDGMPRIVDSAVFDRVQAILDSRRHYHRYTQKHYYGLTGFVFCGICGKRCTGDAITHGSPGKRTLVETYECGNRRSKGYLSCGNRRIRRQVLDDFVYQKLGELVFDEENIPRLIAAYQESKGSLLSEAAEAAQNLRRQLKTVEQKITNLISVIAATGSASLAEELTRLEGEKELLLYQIREKESEFQANELRAEDIVMAYREAQAMYESGDIELREQLRNLYLHKVIVYPEYVEVQLNAVPMHLQSSLFTEDTPAAAGLHSWTLKVLKPLKNRKNETAQVKGIVTFNLDHRGGAKLSLNEHSGPSISSASDARLSGTSTVFLFPEKEKTIFSVSSKTYTATRNVSKSLA